MYNIPIKHWMEDDRPREKMMTKGKNSLSNAELLAIVLRSGTKELSALHVAQELLASVNGDLNALSRKSIKELKKFRGVGDVKAIEIAAVMELARRKRKVKITQKSSIKCSADAFNQLCPGFEDLEHEEFHVLYLNRANKVIANEQVSKGGVAGTVADGKIIFSHALQHKASGIILAHNHPSGSCQPSHTDLKLTKSLLQFGQLIDVHVLDHLIIAGNNYFSFADEGKLNS